MKRLIRKAEDVMQQDTNQNSNQDINQDTTQETNTMQDNIPAVDSNMMQQLRDEVKEDFENANNTNMILLDQLDEADVRHDKCPQCKYQPMVRKEGFKICPSCGAIYKMLDGKGYNLIG
jgi:rubrerythrin